MRYLNEYNKFGGKSSDIILSAADNYSVKIVNSYELPKQLLDRYKLDKDKCYFSRYHSELKHPLMVKQWYDYFKPKSVIDLGCGRGAYLHFFTWFVDDCKGIDISEYAKNHPECDKKFVTCENLLEFNSEKKYV